MTSRDSPAAEIDIAPELVQSLLASQHPDLADLRITFLAEGWDNSQYRLGEGLIVRVPRRQLAVPLIEHEQMWLPRLAPKLPLPIPAPVRFGRPSELFPWPWSVVPWVSGVDAIHARVADTAATGERLGRFFSALHRPAPADAPENRFRGIPLSQRADRDRPVLVQLLKSELLPQIAFDIWREACDAQQHQGPPVWLHGDAHAGNMVVAGGTVVSMIDWGDITSGDPASDLVGLWMVLDRSGRRIARSVLGHDEHTWTRGRGWAVAIAAMLLANSADRPEYFELGQRTITEVVKSAN